MKMRIFFLMVSFVLLLALAACASQPGVLEIEVVPATQSGQITAVLEQIQPVAIAFLSGISDDRRLLFAFQETTCAPEAEAGDGPFCLAGEQAGSAVKVFPVGGMQHTFLRPEEIGQILDWSGEDLYAVFRASQEGGAKNYWPEGEYGLLFSRTELGKPSPIVALVGGGRLVRLDVYPGLTPEEVLDRLPLGGMILTPSEAKAWSVPLKSLQVQSQEFAREDLQWSAQMIIALPQDGGNQYYRWMAVSNQDGSIHWKVVNEWAPFAASYTAPMPFYWPPKSPFLYWTNTPTPEGCVVFANASDLHRLDLNTGVSHQLLESVGQWLSLSPDETQVAAAGREDLTLYSLASGEKRSVALPAGQAGHIIWSPEGQALVLTVADTPCGDPEQATYSVLRVDTLTMQVTKLIDHDPRRFSTLQWSLVGSVLLADKNGDPWQMDPQSGDVWQETGSAEGQGSSGDNAAIFGWVDRGDSGTAQENLLGGVLVRLGAGSCPSSGLAESTTITTDISFSFTNLPAGTYCVSIDPGEPANQAVLPPGQWVLPMHTQGIVQTTVVLAEGETRYNTNFTWMPTAP